MPRALGLSQSSRCTICVAAAVVGTVPHQPQYTHKRFYYDDVMEDSAGIRGYRYQVVAVDRNGTISRTLEMAVT